MHFGRVEDDRNLDLSLPEPRARTLGYLGLPHQGRRLVYVGAPIWAEKQWVGGLYPEGTRPSDFLKVYAQHYSTVEYNGSFYHPPTPEQIRSWTRVVGTEFRFCPKVPQSISHTLTKQLDRSALAHYLGLLEHFGSHYGMSFLQLPDHFAPQHTPALEQLLRAWSPEWPLAIEFRHPAWFLRDQMLPDPVINLLYKQKVSAVITDTPGRRDVLHMSLTFPQVVVRFLGCFPSARDDQRLKAWARRFQEWTQAGLDAIYFFAHQARHGAIPSTVDAMQRYCLELGMPGVMRPAAGLGVEWGEGDEELRLG